MKKKIIMGLLCAGVLALSACGNKTSAFVEEVVMVIDEQEVMKSEYMTYMYMNTQALLSVGGEEIWDMEMDGMNADELIQTQVLQTMQTVIAAGDYAQENEIVLEEQYKEKSIEDAKSFLATVSEEDIAKIGVKEELMASYMEKSYLYSIVYQNIANEYVVAEEEKEAYHTENKELIKEQYTEVATNMIMLDDKEVAEEVAQKAKDGEDFDALFEAHDISPEAQESEEKGKLTIYKDQFLSTFTLEEVPPVGEVLGPIDMQGTYFVVLVEEITVPTDKDVRMISDGSVMNTAQSAHADKAFAEMVEAQTVEIKEDVYGNLENFHK